MAYEIFWGAGSPYSWRVLLGLEVKGLEYKATLLEFSKREHRTPSMLALNPRGFLPVLKDGDLAIYESIAILAYLDSKHLEIPLFGTTARQTGHIWQRVLEIENYLRPAMASIILPIFLDNVADSLASIKKSARHVERELKTLEADLAKSYYLSGQTMSAADIALFPFIQALLRAMTFETAEALALDFLFFNKHYPAITHWMTRIEATPGYDNTYPPNWKD